MELKWLHDFTLFEDATAHIKKRRYFTEALRENRGLPFLLLFKQAGIIILQFPNNYN